jgi:CMP-N-acetylneuraminic acid synthetase
MKILALITARGGSKRLPGKNIRLLGGKPLIVWSIDVARGAPEICDILVSTDDPAIATVCSEAGAYVPWLRPAELATDTAGSVDVALHALDWYEAEKGAVDGVLLLQPTSPFRTRETVRKGIKLFSKNGRQAVLGVSPTHAHPMWMMKKEGEYLVPLMQEHGFGTRSQDLPPAFVVNGSFYLISPAELRERRSLVGMKTMPLIIESPQEALDIDTEWDLKMAEVVLMMSESNSK